MKKAWFVALREVKAYLIDTGDLAFSLLLPIAIFTLMYFAFSGQTLFQGTASVVNLDEGGSYSTALIEKLESLDNLEVDIIPFDEADRKLDDSNLSMVIVIPEDFSTSLEAGQPTELIFRQRGNGGQEGQIVASMVRGAAEEINQGFQVNDMVSLLLAESGIPDEQIKATTAAILTEEKANPSVIVRETSVGSSPDPINLFLPGVITMFVLFSLTLTAATFIEERRVGTLERLLTTRLTIGQLFFGKFLANVSRGFIQTVILLGLSYAVFQLFTPLTFLYCLVIALVFAGASSAIGLVLASVARSQNQATWIGVFFTMTMVMLGGTFFEVAEGTVFYSLGRFSLNTYANEAFRTVITRGGSLGDLGTEFLVMIAVIVIGLLLSRIFFRAMPGGR